jgi:hypothetical protein
VALTLVVPTDRQQLEAAQTRVERSASRYQRLLRDLTAALEAEELAELALADRVHALNRAGVEGKNQAERDAAIHEGTAVERAAVLEAHRLTRRRRSAAERAQHTYDVARYAHRTWRVIVARESGVGGEDTW